MLVHSGPQWDILEGCYIQFSILAECQRHEVRSQSGAKGGLYGSNIEV